MDGLKSIGPLAAIVAVGLASAEFAKVGAVLDGNAAPKTVAAVTAPASPPKPPAPGFAGSPEPPPVACTPAYSTVELWSGNDGHFRPDVEVNGVSLKMVVSTGASFVSISASDANRLGLKAAPGQTVNLRTANGVISAAKKTLRRVTVGKMTLCDVDAVLLPASGLGLFGGQAETSLLGLSYLGRIAGYAVHAGKLVLSP